MVFCYIYILKCYIMAFIVNSMLNIKIKNCDINFYLYFCNEIIYTTK